jgi:hypothetical protein
MIYDNRASLSRMLVAVRSIMEYKSSLTISFIAVRQKVLWRKNPSWKSALKSRQVHSTWACQPCDSDGEHKEHNASCRVVM